MNYKLLFPFFILLIGYFTLFQNYQNPPKQFWDENYHIASAQKYIDGVMFMEPHPPLGKLLIAFGEKIINPNKNIDKSGFDKTDYIRKFPKNLSYEGYRFFPTLFAWLNSVLFFYILVYLLKSRFLAFLFTSLYLFDNAVIVHSRSAMLESTQLFFIFSSVLYFLYIYYESKYKLLNYIILSFFIGLGIAVKLNGLIMILLFVPMFFHEFKISLPSYIIKLSSGFVVIAVVFLGFMYIHTALGVKMPVNKTYGMSKEYRQIIKKGETSSIKNFPVMLRDNLIYMKSYSKGVPRYNPCKKGGENGSLAYTWPFGNKTINYRWEKHNGKVQYLYLMPNPVVWFLGFTGILLSTILIGSKLIFNLKIEDKKTFELISLFTFIYFSYMIVMVNIPRVMYLYHYFIPLEFSLFLFVLVFRYIYSEYIEKNDLVLLSSVVILTITVFIAYWYFSPLTYYKPLSYDEFIKRIWVEYWHLKAVR